MTAPAIAAGNHAGTRRSSLPPLADFAPLADFVPLADFASSVDFAPSAGSGRAPVDAGRFHGADARAAIFIPDGIDSFSLTSGRCSGRTSGSPYSTYDAHASAAMPARSITAARACRTAAPIALPSVRWR